MKWKRDWGLTSRVILTMFLLFVVYLVFIAVLLALGISMSFMILIVVVMAFIQYFFSDKLVLWSTGSGLSRTMSTRNCTRPWKNSVKRQTCPNQG